MTHYIMKTHLSLNGLEISTRLRDLQNVSPCGRVWLACFLTQCDCLSDAIPRLNSVIQCEKTSLYFRFTLSAVFTWVSLPESLKSVMKYSSTLQGKLYTYWSSFCLGRHFCSLTQKRVWKNIKAIWILVSTLSAFSHISKCSPLSCLAYWFSVSNLLLLSVSHYFLVLFSRW